MQSSCAGPFVLHDGARDGLRLAVARVGIDNRGQAGRLRDFTNGATHFTERDQPDIGNASNVGGRPPGNVTRVKPSSCDRAPDQRIERPRRNNRAALHGLSKDSAGMGGHVRMLGSMNGFAQGRSVT